MEPLDSVTSPLFPQLALSPETSLKLPSKPLSHSGSVQLYLILAEKTLYIQGFDENEYKERPPLLLRGSLFLKVTKPVKIKLINLKFSGVSKTDWPEGIPPKKQEYLEVNQLIQHTWPFFNANAGFTDANKGANIFKPLDPSIDEISSFSLEPVLTNRESSGSLANAFRRAASPSPIRSRSNTASGAASSLFSHLTGSSTNNILDSTSSNDLQSIRSSDTIVDSNSNKTFQPGDYIYNFELAIPLSTPESISVTFGSVNYTLEASVERSGAFKTSLLGKETITIVRTPADTSLEENEPIAIIRDWEDKLRYEIVIASKAIVLNTYLPLAFKLTPLEKIQLHRIRVYLTENLEYYCRHKKIHRLEPTKKYLLLEHKPQEGSTSLLGDEEITARELEFQLYIPEKLNEKQRLHPDTSYSNIQSHHWIKICLRLSKPEPTDDNPSKRKHYEISIDSPIHVLSPMATHANTLLPSYDQLQALPIDYFRNPPLSPNVILIDNSLDALMVSPPRLPQREVVDPYYVPPNMHLESNIYSPDHLLPELQSPQAQPFSPMISPEMAALSPHLQSLSSPRIGTMNSPSMAPRPIHLLRRPSVNPPPFSADAPPPPCDDEPPAYQENDELARDTREEDIGETFEFTGLSPNLPAAILRATSPARRSRSASRLRLSTTKPDSRGRSPHEPARSPVRPKPQAKPQANRVMPRTAESFLNDMDDNDEEPPAKYLAPLNLNLNSNLILTSAPSSSQTGQVADSTLSPTSSIASSSLHSISSNETQFDPIGEPLLNSTTSTSTLDQRHHAGGRDRFQSIQSTDITSMYSMSNNTESSLAGPLNQGRSESLWHPLDSDFTQINNPHLFKKPVFKKNFATPEDNHIEAPPIIKEPLRQMSFGVEQIIQGLPSQETTSQLITEATTTTTTTTTSTTEASHNESSSTLQTKGAVNRGQRSASSGGTSLNSNTSSATLNSDNSNEERFRLVNNDRSSEIRKLSTTSNTRPTTLNQDTALNI